MPLWKKRSGAPTRHTDPDAAIALYLEELRQAEVAGAPTPAAALNGLGDAHLDKGDVVSAVDYYRQAAEVYEREGMHDNAIACCRKIRRYAPEDSDVALMLGRYYAAKGLRANAVAELETYADRQSRAGRRREALDALREIVRLAPDRAGRREQLANLLAESEQRGEALAEYRLVLERYRSEGDLPGIERVRAAIVGLEARPAPAPPPASPPATPRAAVAPSAPPSSARPAAAISRPPAVAPPPVEPPTPAATPPPAASVPSALEIERTAYEEEAPPAPAPPLTVAQEAAGFGPPVPAGTEDVPPKPDEALAEAERHVAAGRWQEAIRLYRRLAELGHASPDDFAAWAECARQAGEAPKVLEALSAAARHFLARGDQQAARRAAEEMLLLDPNSAVAADILEKVGTSLPRG